MSVKVGIPTTEVPQPGSTRGGGKYAELYRSIDRLPEGEWLPVVFPTKKRAYNFRLAVETHRTRLMEAMLRNRTVYVRNRPTERAPNGTEGGKRR